MKKTHIISSIAAIVLTTALSAKAETPRSASDTLQPIADFNFQDDYICNAKPGNLVTTGNIDFLTSKKQRFGFTYPVTMLNIWVKQMGADWQVFDLANAVNLDAYEGVRVQLEQQTQDCKQGEVAVSVNREFKETLITAQVCYSGSMQKADAQVLFEALK